MTPTDMAKASTESHHIAHAVSFHQTAYHSVMAGQAGNHQPFARDMHLHMAQAHAHVADAHKAMLEGDHAGAAHHVERAEHHSHQANLNTGIHIHDDDDFTDHEHDDLEHEDADGHGILHDAIAAAKSYHAQGAAHPAPLFGSAALPQLTGPSNPTMSKGVLDSIKNMLRGRRSEANTGPVTRTAPAASPASAPSAPKLSGRAEDHADHAANITHLMQTGHNNEGAKTSFGWLRQAHASMHQARTAYDAGNTKLASQHLQNAQTHLGHAEKASKQVVTFHGDALHGRMKELHSALGGTIAKADSMQDMVAGLYRSR